MIPQSVSIPLLLSFQSIGSKLFDSMFSFFSIRFLQYSIFFSLHLLQRYWFFRFLKNFFFPKQLHNLFGLKALFYENFQQFPSLAQDEAASMHPVDADNYRSTLKKSY